MSFTYNRNLYYTPFTEIFSFFIHTNTFSHTSIIGLREKPKTTTRAATKTKRIHIRINYYCFVATRTIWIWFSFASTWCHDLLIFVVASVFVSAKQNQRVFVRWASENVEENNIRSSVFQEYGFLLLLWLLLGVNVAKQHHRITCNWIHNPK